MPDISLYIGHSIYAGWKRASITRSLDAVSGRFDLETIDRWDAKTQRWTIFPGDRCQVKIDDIPLITGWVDKAAPSYSKDAHAIQISGRDRTGDLVDCSAVVAGNELRGLTLAGIASAIARPFGIKVVEQVASGEGFPVFAIQPGETCWEAIERAARQRFMVVTTNGLGDLVIADIGAERAHDALIEGQNIKEAAGNYDNTQRFSEYIVRGQSIPANDGWDPARAAVESRSTDDNVKRYRPKILQPETQASDGSAANRAELEAATRAAKSTKVTVTVQGWTQTNGELWPLNALVQIRSPMLSLDTELLISSVKFSIDDSQGFTTELELTRPDAYLLGQRKAKKGKKEKAKGVGADPWDSYNPDD